MAVFEEALGRARAKAEAGDWQDAFGALRPVLELPGEEVADAARLAEALGVFARVSDELDMGSWRAWPARRASPRTTRRSCSTSTTS